MWRHCCAGLLLATLMWLGNARAAVVMIDASQAVAPPRSDPGTGICASTIHLRAGFGGFRSTDGSDATEYLDKDWTTDPNITGRVSRLLPLVNLRNGDPSSLGDFTAASGTDDYLPFSSASQAVPQGDDFNIALRLRGYWNVPTALVGKTIAFGLLCDDLCVLKVGKDRIALAPIASTQLLTSRMIYRVQFGGSGLYPMEAVYYQNGSAGSLEWSRTSLDVAECPSGLCTVPLTDASYNGSFRVVDRRELYSSLDGESGCLECGASGQSCTPGNFCGDGLCQRCDLPEHCGPSCASCPPNARVCSAGRCVECTADDQCAVGRSCDLSNGRCRAPISCTQDRDCPFYHRCDPHELICLPLRWCVDATGCQAGEICLLDICQAPQAPCDSDAGCATEQHCTDWHLCASGARASGCDVASHRATTPFASMLGIAALLGIWKIRRRRGYTGDDQNGA